MDRTGRKKTRGVGGSGTILLFRDRPIATRGTHTVVMLTDLDCHPAAFRQGGDQSGNHAGFAYAARVSADDDEGHEDRRSVVVDLCWLTDCLGQFCFTRQRSTTGYRL